MTGFTVSWVRAEQVDGAGTGHGPSPSTRATPPAPRPRPGAGARRARSWVSGRTRSAPTQGVEQVGGEDRRSAGPASRLGRRVRSPASSLAGRLVLEQQGSSSAGRASQPKAIERAARRRWRRGDAARGSRRPASPWPPPRPRRRPRPGRSRSAARSRQCAPNADEATPPLGLHPCSCRPGRRAMIAASATASTRPPDSRADDPRPPPGRPRPSGRRAGAATAWRPGERSRSRPRPPRRPPRSSADGAAGRARRPSRSPSPSPRCPAPARSHRGRSPAPPGVPSPPSVPAGHPHAVEPDRRNGPLPTAPAPAGRAPPPAAAPHRPARSGQQAGRIEVVQVLAHVSDASRDHRQSIAPKAPFHKGSRTFSEL